MKDNTRVLLNHDSSTYSEANSEPMTIESLKKAADFIQKKESKPLPKGLGWFTRLMAKLGWHRKYEIIWVRDSKFKFW